MTFSYDLEFSDGTKGTVVVAVDASSVTDEESNAFFDFVGEALAEWFGGESETVDAIVH
jgi:hypothetical protein